MVRLEVRLMLTLRSVIALWETWLARLEEWVSAACQDRAVDRADILRELEARLGSRKAANDALEAVLDTIVREVVRGGRVSITGFGTFDRVERAARTGRNPSTGTSVRIPKAKAPRFRAGTAFKSYVKKPSGLPKSPPATARAAAGAASTAVEPARLGRKVAPKKATATKAPASEGARESGSQEGDRDEGARESGSQEGARESGSQEGARESGSQEGARDEGARESGSQEGARDEGARESGSQEGARDEGARESGSQEGAGTRR